jgi:hypothetical protein
MHVPFMSNARDIASYICDASRGSVCYSTGLPSSITAGYGSQFCFLNGT